MDQPARSWQRPPAEPGERGGMLARARALLAGLGCGPAEALALGVLATAAVAALGLMGIALHGRTGAETAGRASNGAITAGETADAGLRVEAPAPQLVVVHVVGRVAAPGVYRLPDGARVGDALTAAGGALPEAALQALNLARPLSDGEQLVVPAVGEAAATPGAGSAEAPSAVRADGLLDLNLATADDLEELPGVGPVLAERIVAQRESVGGRFASVGDLREVPGIGESRFQTIAELVTL